MCLGTCSVVRYFLKHFFFLLTFSKHAYLSHAPRLQCEGLKIIVHFIHSADLQQTGENPECYLELGL